MNMRFIRRSIDVLCSCTCVLWHACSVFELLMQSFGPRIHSEHCMSHRRCDMRMCPRWGNGEKRETNVRRQKRSVVFAVWHWDWALMGIGVIGGLIHGIRDGRLRPAALHDMIADCLILPVCIVQLVLLCGSCWLRWVIVSGEIESGWTLKPRYWLGLTPLVYPTLR